MVMNVKLPQGAFWSTNILSTHPLLAAVSVNIYPSVLHAATVVRGEWSPKTVDSDSVC